MNGLLDVSVWLLGLSLCMDTFALSLSTGLSARRVPLRGFLRAELCFAGIQTLFLWLGSLVGGAASQFLDGTQWIVFALLVIIGGLMIREALTEDEDEKVSEDVAKEEAAIEEKIEEREGEEAEKEGAKPVPTPVVLTEAEEDALRMKSVFAWKLLISLGVATSIDAIGVGAAEGLAGAPIAADVTATFVMSAIACGLGLMLGGKLGSKWKKGAGIVGGILLICLGIKQVLPF